MGNSTSRAYWGRGSSNNSNSNMRRTRPLLLLLTLSALLTLSVDFVAVWGDEMTASDEMTTRYSPNWPSLDSRPLPQWYDEAKIGIFMHFGPYAVPGVSSEWFWYQSVRNESDSDHKCSQYLRDYFPPKFTYQDFGPQLTMEFFDPEAIADIVNASGANYLVFTSKHHDGFCNWPSSYSYGWNSMAVGPQRDVLMELKEAFARRHPHIHFGLYYSLFEWFNPIYLKDKASNYTNKDYVQNKMIPEMKELVERYAPDVLWADGDWEAEDEYWESKNFLAWLYNDSPSKDSVVTNDRWGRGTAMTHGGFYSGPDRYDPGVLIPHKWESAMTVDSESWGIRRDIRLSDLLSTSDLITKVVTSISCNGNILINVGPSKEGTIIPIFEERLRDLGSWLKINGEALYSSRPWTHQNDSANGDVWYTRKEDVVYAIALKWPDDDVLKVADAKVEEGVTTITMLGLPDQPLTYTTSDTELSINFPSMSSLMRACGPGCQWGYVLKIEGLNQV